jgi:hypothetical protein
MADEKSLTHSGGFRFFYEKSVVGEEIFNTAWLANPKLESVAISVTPQSRGAQSV